MSFKFIDNSQILMAKINRALDEAVTETAEAIAAEAAELAPKKTGELSRSYKNRKIGVAHEQIGSSLDYSKFQELGTVKMAAQPHLVPAAELNKDEFPKKIVEKIKS